MALPSVGCAIDVASGVLLILLAAGIALVRPRRPVNWALIAFSSGWGAFVVSGNLNERTDCGANIGMDIAWIFGAAAAAGLVALVLLYPGRWPRSAWPHLLVAALVGLVYMLAFEYYPGFNRTGAGQGFLRGALWTGILLLAFRPAVMGPAAFDDGRRVALLATALILEPSFRAGAIASGGGGWDPILGALGLGICGMVAARWLWNGARGPKELRGSAQRVALLTVALPLIAIVVHPHYDVFDGGPMGLMRTLTVGMVAYAILRHQLLGIDLKVKWTISRGTVAAVVLGVFFMVTSLAQNFFSEQYGWIYGGIATGVLLFAIHPIQRMGERVANAALPGVKPLAQMDRAERLALYRAQLAAAWRDGNLTMNERRVLEVTRERLGISSDDALRLEREVAP